MVKMKIRKYMGVLLFLTTFIVLITFISHRDNLDLYDRLLITCEESNTIKIKDITNFDWDIAYIDKQNYGVGEQILQKGIVGDFKALESDFLYRIAFCKDNTLVYDLILNEDFISIDNSIFEFTPQTTLHIKRSQENPERYLLSTKDWQD